MATATVEIPTQMLQIRRKILGDFAVHLSLMLFHELLILFPMAIFVLLLSGPQLCYLDLNVCYLILQFLHVVPVVHEEVVVVLYLYLEYRDTAVKLYPCAHKSHQYSDESATCTGGYDRILSCKLNADSAIP